MPLSDAVASTNTSASCARQIGPSSASGCAMVVEVSPCTSATSRGRWVRTASSMRCGSNTVPHSVSMLITSARQRRAISHSRCPKRPNTGTSTLSPGSSTETSTASMPARAVPSTIKVQRLAVRNTCRYRLMISFM